MNLESEKLKKLKKINKKDLFCIIFFLGLTLFCFGMGYYLNQLDKKETISLHELLKVQSSETGRKVNLTVTEKPYLFAEYDKDVLTDKFYFLMDENYLYVGYLDFGTYNELNNDKITSEPITIKGKTKTIPNDVVDIAIESYNELAEKEILTKENYKDYIGAICIDTTEEDDDDNVFIIILGVFFLIAMLIYLGYVLLKINKYNKTIKKMDSHDYDNIVRELERSDCKDYDEFKVYLTDNYIVDGKKGLNIIPYKDIVWAYLYEHRYNGIANDRYLVIYTKDKKKHTVAEMPITLKQTKEVYNEMLQNIYNKNQSMLLGYTKENKKQAKDLYGIK